MKFNGTIIGIGILAGLASALMSSGVIAQGGAMAAMAMVLYFLTPLPIFVVALGWGSSAGIVAAATATIAVGVVAVPLAALLMALTSFIPAATGAICPASRGQPKNSADRRTFWSGIRCRTSCFGLL